MNRKLIIILYQEGEKICGKNEQKFKKLCKTISSKLIKEANQSLSHTLTFLHTPLI